MERAGAERSGRRRGAAVAAAVASIAEHVPAHTCVFHDKFYTRRVNQNGTTKQDPLAVRRNSVRARSPVAIL